MTQGVGSGADLHVPKNIAELAVLNGMPAVHANRTVTIAQRALKTVQSGQSHAHQWQITWASEERWKNPLMGWTSSADPMSQVHVRTLSLAALKITRTWYNRAAMMFSFSCTSTRRRRPSASRSATTGSSRSCERPTRAPRRWDTRSTRTTSSPREYVLLNWKRLSCWCLSVCNGLASIAFFCSTDRAGGQERRPQEHHLRQPQLRQVALVHAAEVPRRRRGAPARPLPRNRRQLSSQPACGLWRRLQR